MDLLVEPIDSVTRIETRKGAVRGNHYHAATVQFTYVITGQLYVVTRMRFGDPTKLVEDYLHAGEMMMSPPDELHAWRAQVDTEAIVFTRGPRSGEGYEDDTFRLDADKRLIDP